MAGPWEKYGGSNQPAPQAAPQAAPQSAYPGVIRGAPKPVDPYKAASERRAEEDQAIQRERAELARQSEQRADRKESREIERKEAGFDATEGERKAAAFLIRALGSNASYESTGVGPRSLVGQGLSETMPSVLNSLPEAIGNSPERQVSDSAQEEFIAASLRQDSGAAIPEEEMDRQRRIYFPMPGDTEAAIEQKRQARLRAIQGLEQSSGRLLGQTMERWEQMQAPVPEQEPEQNNDDNTQAAGLSFGTGGGQGFGDDGQGNPLIVKTENGLEVLLTGEGPNQYGVVGELDDLRGVADPRAFDMLTQLQQRNEIQGEAGVMDLAKQGFTFGLMDESSGVGTAIGRALTGDFNIAENYALGRDTERLRLEGARGDTGTAGTVVEVGSALATPSGAFKGVMSLGQAARTGAVAGGVGGFGYGEGAEGSAANALVGAGGGAILGVGGQKVGNALAQRAASKAQNGRQVQSSADDLGIDVIPAMTGGAGTQRLTGAARQGFVSDRPIAAQVAKMEGQGQAARGQIANDVGRIVDADDGGEIVRSAANVYSARTSEIGGKLYARADKFAGDAKFPLPTAVQAIDQEMTQLAKAPGGKEGSLYKSLATLKRQIGKGKFHVDGIRAFRTTLRNEISGQGLRGSPQDVAYNRVLKAAEEDMLSGLSAAGNEKAVGALKTATAFWRKRVETIDEVLEPVLGKNSQRSGEQVLAAVERLARPDSGNASRLRQLIKAMPDEEANSVRATVIARMGRPTKGAAELAEEGGFSFNTFLTNWNNMTPRAKATMFPGESIRELNKLAQVSKGYKQAGGAMNTSNTGGAVINQGAVSGALWLLDPIASGAGLIGQYGLGKLLASPRFARWLAGAPKNTSAAGKKRYASQLGQIAKAQPALAGDLQILERVVLKAANDNAGRMSAVAEDSTDQMPRE